MLIGQALRSEQDDFSDRGSGGEISWIVPQIRVACTAAPQTGHGRSQRAESGRAGPGRC